MATFYVANDLSVNNSPGRNFVPVVQWEDFVTTGLHEEERVPSDPNVQVDLVVYLTDNTPSVAAEEVEGMGIVEDNLDILEVAYGIAEAARVALQGMRVVLVDERVDDCVLYAVRIHVVVVATISVSVKVILK